MYGCQGGALTSSFVHLIHTVHVSSSQHSLLQVLHIAAPSLTQQFDYASQRSIPILVTIVSNTFQASDTVKVPYQPMLLMAVCIMKCNCGAARSRLSSN